MIARFWTEKLFFKEAFALATPSFNPVLSLLVKEVFVPDCTFPALAFWEASWEVFPEPLLEPLPLASDLSITLPSSKTLFSSIKPAFCPTLNIFSRTLVTTLLKVCFVEERTDFIFCKAAELLLRLSSFAACLPNSWIP